VTFWRSWLALVCIALAAQQLAAESAPTVDSVRFRNFGIASGLSQITARAIVQDQQGFIWIGTQDGLNRFDGYDFRTYYRDRRNPGALSDSHISALELAENGALWVATVAGGINLLDPATELIENFRHDAARADSLSADGVLSLMMARDGHLWVSTNAGGVQKLAAGSKVFVDMRPSTGELGVVRDLLEGASGEIWLGGSKGLWRYQPADNTWQHWAQAQGVLSDIQALALTPQGEVWIGSTRDGLMRVDAFGRPTASYRMDPTIDGSLPDDQIRTLLVTRAGQLWVGTMNGLAIYEAQSGRFLAWRYDAGDPGSPAGNRIASLFEDRDGLIWIGTWTGGFSIHNPATQVVRLIRAHGRDRTSLPASPVRALYMDTDGSLWMGLLEGGGLVHYDLERGVLRRWTQDPADASSLGSNVVQSITRTRDGKLWVGTQGAGISRMRADGNGFDHFRAIQDDENSLPDNGIQVLFVDRDGQLWVGMDTGGLARWRGEGQGFERFRNDPADSNSLGSNSVYSIAETRDGTLWIGTFGSGLAKFDPDTRQFQHFRHQPGDLDSISHNSVSMIVEASDGTLWVGTQGGGVNQVTRAADGELHFRAIGKPEGLGAEAIGTLVEDRNGLVWIGTTVGVNAYDPRTQEVQSFSANDGMDRSGYFIGSVSRGAGGEIYFGGLRGVLAFNPDRLPRRGHPPRVEFTQFLIDNRPPALRRDDPKSPLVRAIHAVDEVDLEHDVSSVSVGYSALDFANPDGVRYSYRLDGYDRDWIEGPNLPRTAAYTNLASGDYRLRVRARDGEGGAYGEESILKLRILPSLWLTTGAKLLYLILLLAFVALAVTRVRRRWTLDFRAREAIRRSEERLKLALWGSRDELWDLDLNSGRMDRENLLPILGTSASLNFHNREDFLAHVHPDEQLMVHESIGRHIRGESDFYENTFRMRTLDGQWCWVLSRGFAVERDTEGRALRMVGTSRNVSASAEAAEALRKLNDELEHRVDERTRALRLSNRELQFTLGELKQMQRQLVESEKMAALGGLVAGIAHEINTPLGIGVTAASHLEDETRRFMKLMSEGTLSRADLERYQTDALSSAQLILSNLRRAGQLIRSFKQVAVDQSSEQAREVHLKTYLEEVLVSLGPALKKTQHQVLLQCPDDLRLYTFPGAISQIVVNLVMNSLIHAFDGIESGEIRIHCETYDEEWLLLYRDNGNGMNDETRQRVFDPFFTTKRGQGGSGLGLHVVYNLVTQLLHGSLDCVSSPGQGVEFQIQLPRRAP